MPLPPDSSGRFLEPLSRPWHSYTRRFNVRHKQWGRLFDDRYKSVLVESERSDVGGSGGSSYLTTLLNYIHLNPDRARLLNHAKGQSILDFPWSSVAGAYALSPKKRPPWMQVSGGLEMFGFKDKAADRREFVARLDARAAAEAAKRCGLAEIEGQTLNSTLRRGWYWGSEDFKEALMTKLDERKLDDG